LSKRLVVLDEYEQSGQHKEPILLTYETQLNDTWKQFNSIQNELERLDEEESERFRDVFMQHLDLTTQLNCLIKEAQLASSSKPTTGESVTVSGPIAIKFSDIHLPQFDGTVENWESFYDTFSSTVDRNEGLTPVQKLHYLRSSLTGIAAQSIQSLDTTEANYAIALATLKEKFDYPRQRSMRDWHAIADYPRLSKETPTAIGACTENIRQHLRVLDNSGESLSDIALISVILAKLSTDTVHQWELTLPDNKMLSPSHLLAFLDKRASCGKMSPKPTPAVKTPERKPIEQRYHTRQTASRGHACAMTHSPVICPICYGSHDIWRCEIFQAKSVKERTDLAKRASLCTNCLGEGHLRSQCSARSCRVCNQRHQTLLHTDKPQIPMRSGTSRRSPTARSTHRSLPPSSPNQTPPSSPRRSRKFNSSPTFSPPRRRTE
jgi:hypothetical protein